jgi:crotonobetainyl-CoA:carnitine CoA-transferase CaiB-like acyl-CoA transferase
VAPHAGSGAWRGRGWVTAEPAAQSDRTPARIRALAPLLGADSSAILAELGYGAGDIARLEREQIVHKPSVSGSR